MLVLRVDSKIHVPMLEISGRAKSLRNYKKVRRLSCKDDSRAHGESKDESPFQISESNSRRKWQG